MLKPLILSLFILATASLVAASFQPRTAATQEDPQAVATIEALQTRVAELEAQVGEPEKPGSAESGSSQADSIWDSERLLPESIEPIALAPGLELLYYYAVDDSFGGVRILGEVKNTTDHAIDGPTLQFTFLDENGNILGSERGHTVFLVIPAGMTMPFDLSVYDLNLDGWSTEEIGLCSWGDGLSFATDPDYNSNGLLLQNVEEVVKEEDQLQITGEVLNESGETAENVYVRALIYDESGRYTGDVSQGIEVPIPSEKSARFTLDEGVTSFSSGEPLEIAGGNYTYELRLSRDSGVRVSAC